jgi:hypothetical protein
MRRTHQDTRRYPRLTRPQLERICGEVRLYLAAMNWIRSGYDIRALAFCRMQPPVTTTGEQLALF